MSVSERRQSDVAKAKLAASVASYALGMPRKQILTRRRGTAKAAYARHVAFYLCYAGLHLSLGRVAAAFGRDRSTVAHACHALEDRREDPQFDLWIGSHEAMLRATPKWRSTL